MFSLNSKKALLFPSFIAFIVVCILVFKFSFPVSWDVYYHIHMADLYKANGLVFWDYLTVAPKGRLIMYPPLFHLMLSFISNIGGFDLIFLTRILQPFFAFILILTITYCAYLLGDVKVGFFTGFIAMLSFVTFNRGVICTPATLAIGLSMLCCVFFYKSITDDNYKYMIISAVCLGVIANIHMADFILTCGFIGLYGLIQLLRRKLSFKKLVLFVLISFIIASPWWIYVELNYGLFFNSIGAKSIFIGDFLFKYFGIIPAVFLFAGFYYLYRLRSEKSLFLYLWCFSLIILGQLTYFGLNTVGIRILEVASYPMILVAGIGFVYLLDLIGSSRTRKIICILLIVYSSLLAVIYTDSYTPDVLKEGDVDGNLIPCSFSNVLDPVGTTLKPSVIAQRYADSTLSHNRFEIMDWFVNNSDGSIVVCEDSILDTLIVSTSRTPVIYGGFTESIASYVVDPVHIVNNMSTKSELDDLGISYLVIKKKTPVSDYAGCVYENGDYKICCINV